MYEFFRYRGAIFTPNILLPILMRPCWVIFGKMIINLPILLLRLTHQMHRQLLQIELQSISVIIKSNRSVISFRSVNLIEFTDISVSVNYRSVSVNSVSVSVFLFTEPIYRLYN